MQFLERHPLVIKEHHQTVPIAQHIKIHLEIEVLQPNQETPQEILTAPFQNRAQAEARAIQLPVLILAAVTTTEIVATRPLVQDQVHLTAAGEALPLQAQDLITPLVEVVVVVVVLEDDNKFPCFYLT